MADLVAMARELGKALQSDERYIAMRVAQQACEADADLQQRIGEFNLKRMAINHEAQKDERDEETIKRLNEEFRLVYGEIMKNERMQTYNRLKGEVDQVMEQVNGILSLCAEGEDPDACVYKPASCNGSCSGCSGCG